MYVCQDNGLLAGETETFMLKRAEPSGKNQGGLSRNANSQERRMNVRCGLPHQGTFRETLDFLPTPSYSFLLLRTQPATNSICAFNERKDSVPIF
jgi:hypothetical protein